MLDYEKFEHRMKYMGYSATSLAAKVGISPSIISEWSTGKHEPSLKTIILLAKELGMTVDYFVVKDK